MSNSFIRFKNKARAVCLIKSVLLGLSLGMTVGAALLLMSKLRLVEMEQILSLPIGAAVFLLTGIVAFFLHRKSDKAIARRLDAKFGLNEKVQTMLAYGQEEGAIHRLQREDAERALAEIPIKKFKFGFVWIYAIAAVLGAVALAVALLLPPPVQTPPEIPDVPFKITEMQLSALEELTANVKASRMQEPYRSDVVTSLQTLTGELRAATTERERDASLEKSMGAIYGYTDESSTAVELINALGASGSANVKAFALSIKYFDWLPGSEWDEFYAKINGFRNGFRHVDEESEEKDEAVMLSFVKTLTSATASEITLALKKSGVKDTDELYRALFEYAQANRDGEIKLKGLSGIFEESKGLTYYEIQDRLDVMFDTLGVELFEVIEQHKINTDTGENAMTRLSVLFGYPLPEFKRPDPIRASSDSNAGGSTDDNTGGGGGIGGGASYGSDDLVLDYNTDKYVEYGTLLDQYYELMFGKVKDGDYSDDEKEAMEKYFEILYGGFEEDNKGE